MNASPDDVVDLGTVARLLWSARWRLVAWLAGGAALAAAALFVLPRRWEARATVVARSSEGAGAGLSRSGLTDLVSSAVLGGAGARMESELELLRSHRLRAEVAATLPLAVEVRSPRGVPTTALVSGFEARGRFAPRTLDVARADAGWRVTGEGLDTTVAAGGVVTLPEGRLTLAAAPVAGVSRATLRLVDDQGLQKRLDKRITVERAGGEIASVTTRWEDSVTGALVANALVARYVAWRRENDSNDNSKLVALVDAQIDSVDRALQTALNAMRALQERSGVTDPGASAELLAGRLTRLQTEGRETRVQLASLDTLIAELGRDRSGGAARRLPSFPAFLSSQAIADLLTQLTRLETERTALLQSRTEEDPAVRGRALSIAQVEAQLLPMARTYRATLTEAQRAIAASTDSVQRALAVLPGAGRQYADLTIDLRRLGDMSTALRVQALQLRIATNNAGGGARQVDEAVPTRLPASPVPWIVITIGVVVAAAAGVARELLARATPARDSSAGPPAVP